MQDQVVRLSESSYGKGFVIFQVILPLILHISYYVNYTNFGNTGPRTFVFASGSLNCPDFKNKFQNYHLKLKLFYSVANCLKASARYLFNFEPLFLHN